jgi:hypothetical protein
MLTNWFARRAPRSRTKILSFRPRLESLEERNAPSAVVPMDSGHGNGNGNGNGNSQGNGNGPPGH